MSGRTFGLGVFLALSVFAYACSDDTVAVAPPTTEEPPDAAESTEPPDASAPADAGCSFSGPCTPAGTANPCQKGELGCDGAGNQVCNAVNLADGTVCGADLVCQSGACVACKNGGACTDPNNACKTGTLACANGPTCTNLTNAPNGLSCGTDLVCDNGVCTSCVAGDVCKSTTNPCQEGTLDCTAGAACKNLANAANGTTCGQNKACLNGACTCEPGGPCPTGNPCTAGTATCDANGNPVCGNVKNVNDGTSCGTNMACLQGACVCQPGGSCTLPNQPCKVGKIACTNGAPTCSATGDVTNGSPCGTDMVCNAGACVACKAGGACLAGVCKVGSYSCNTGAQTCTANVQNAQNGTVCDTNGTPNDQVCFNGACNTCVSGQKCNPGGNLCRVGSSDCSSGTLQCANVTNAPEGTACGNGRVCVQGNCQTCVDGAPCAPGGNICQAGSVTGCSTGTPTCTATTTPPTAINNGASCGGAGQTCQNGTCACNNNCTTAGATSCNGTTAVNTCTADPVSGCLTNKSTNCGAAQTCQSGACVCNNTCSTEGATQCVSATLVQRCTKDAQGCLTWQPGTGTSCPGNPAVACTNNACACPAPTATDVYVDYSTSFSGVRRGSDLLGNGSSACPFATLTKGIEFAKTRASATSAQTVHAAAAFYGGETMPLLIPDNVTVVGATSRLGNGFYRITGSAATPTGTQRPTVIMSGGKLSGFELRPAQSDQADTVGIACNAGSPTIEFVTVSRFADGMNLSGTCTAVLNDDRATANSVNGGRGGVVVTGTASAQITSGSFDQNRKAGIHLDSSSTTATTIRAVGQVNNTNANGIVANAGNGVFCGGTAKLQMRLTKVVDNGLAGVRAEASCAADLSGKGTAADATLCGAQNTGGNEMNRFGCNSQNSNTAADVDTSSSIPVKADFNRWKNSPPQSGQNNDYNANNGGSVDVTSSCGQSGC